MALNWLFILVLIILIYNIAAGYGKGLLRMLFRFVASILSFVLAIVLVMVFGETFRTAFPFYRMLENWCGRFADSLTTGNTLIDTVLGRGYMADEIAAAVSTAIFDVLLFVIFFLVLRILLGIVNNLLAKISGIPGIGLLNRILGAGAGLLNGLLLTWILMTILELMSGTAVGDSAAKCIAANDFLYALQLRNVIWNVLAAFLI